MRQGSDEGETLTEQRSSSKPGPIHKANAASHKQHQREQSIQLVRSQPDTTLNPITSTAISRGESRSQTPKTGSFDFMTSAKRRRIQSGPRDETIAKFYQTSSTLQQEVQRLRRENQRLITEDSVKRTMLTNIITSACLIETIIAIRGDELSIGLSRLSKTRIDQLPSRVQELTNYGSKTNSVVSRFIEETREANKALLQPDAHEELHELYENAQPNADDKKLFLSELSFTKRQRSHAIKTEGKRG